MNSKIINGIMDLDENTQNFYNNTGLLLSFSDQKKFIEWFRAAVTAKITNGVLEKLPDEIKDRIWAMHKEYKDKPEDFYNNLKEKLPKVVMSMDQEIANFQNEVINFSKNLSQ